MNSIQKMGDDSNCTQMISRLTSYCSLFTSYSLLVTACCLILTSFSLPITTPAFSDDSFSLSGRINLRGIEALNSDSVREDPGALARIKTDASKYSWRFFSWLEGSIDGTVDEKESRLFKNFDDIYQGNTPYLEFKELFLEHSFNEYDVRLGIQRFSWGRLDEYPVNDLLNPWDYTRFLTKPLEDRKIGVPSLSITTNRGDWSFQGVLIPWLVPYRLPKPVERWAGSSRFQKAAVDVITREPEFPSRNIDNSDIGLRASKTGEIEWGVTIFHGYDKRPVFKSESFVVSQNAVDPGIISSFNKITTIGADMAFVKGDFSIRAETSYSFDRHYNIRHELWGYPPFIYPGVYPLKPIERQSNTIDYGIGADYRLFEDCILILQGQQTIIIDRDDSFFEKKFETLLWLNIKTNWMNQKIETNVNFAYNPEHGSDMAKISGYYTFNDHWKGGVAAVFFNGPDQSIFGKYSINDQIECEVIYSW